MCGTVPDRAATSIGFEAFGWKAPCSELKGPECGSNGGMPGIVGG